MSAVSQEDLRFAYDVEWGDPVTGSVRQFTLLHWPYDLEAELFDPVKRKVFLKRIKCEAVGSAVLQPGALITVCARQLRVIRAADSVTAAAFKARPHTRTFAMVKPDAVQHTSAILTAAAAAGLAVVNLRMARLSTRDAEAFYAVHRDHPFFPTLVAFMTSGPVVAIELEGEEAVATWRKLLGPTNTAAARQQAPQSLRALFGTDGTRNACHGSDARETAAQEAAFFFGEGGEGPRRLTISSAADVTLAIIKPHTTAAGSAGAIWEALQQRFEILAAEGVRLNPAAAQRFHAVYKGVLPAGEFSSMIEQISSGLAIAVALTWRSDSAPAQSSLVDSLREVAGPGDPGIARAVAPTTLRAMFGGDSKALNAVHVTDLARDGPLEVAFFFGTGRET